MKLENRPALTAHLREGQLRPVYLLYGSEGYFIEKCRQDLLAAARRLSPGGCNFDSFDAREGWEPDTLADACEAIPFMADRRCVCLQQLSPEALPAAQFAKLEQLLEDPPPTCLLIITLEAAQAGGKPAKSKGKGRTERLATLCEQKGCALRLEKPTRSDAVRLLTRRAAALGGKLSPQAAGQLLELCGSDLTRLENELAKLCAYAGEQEITQEHIAALATPSLEAGIFQLPAAILRQDYAGSMALLARLLELRETPVAILAALSMSFADIARAAAAAQARVGESQAARVLGYAGGAAYRFTKATGLAPRFSQAFLLQALCLCAQADLQLKSSRLDGRVLLEQTITRLFVCMQQQ